MASHYKIPPELFDIVAKCAVEGNHNDFRELIDYLRVENPELAEKIFPANWGSQY